jgi:hypothetical protein
VRDHLRDQKLGGFGASNSRGDDQLRAEGIYLQQHNMGAQAMPSGKYFLMFFDQRTAASAIIS